MSKKNKGARTPGSPTYVPSREPSGQSSRRVVRDDPLENVLGRIDPWLGLDRPDHFDRLIRVLFGVLLPLGIIGYAVTGLMAGETQFVGRGQTITLAGWAAIWASVGYLSIGLMIHVHNVWTNHERLAGVADAVRYLLGIIIGLSLLGVVWGVLM